MEPGRDQGTPAGAGGVGREGSVPSLPFLSRLGLFSEGGSGYLHTLGDAQKLGSEPLRQVR